MNKPATIIGILLLVVGGLISLGLLTYPENDEVLRLGDHSISVQSNKTPSRTLGYVLLGVGAVLTAAGVGRRRF